MWEGEREGERGEHVHEGGRGGLREEEEAGWQTCLTRRRLRREDGRLRGHAEREGHSCRCEKRCSWRVDSEPLMGEGGEQWTVDVWRRETEVRGAQSPCSRAARVQVECKPG